MRRVLDRTSLSAVLAGLATVATLTLSGCTVQPNLDFVVPSPSAGTGESSCSEELIAGAVPEAVVGEQVYSLVAVEDFQAPEVGLEFFGDSCIVHVKVDGAPGFYRETDIAYIQGDAGIAAAIGDNLVAAGFDKLFDGFYMRGEDFIVSVVEITPDLELNMGNLGAEALGIEPGVPHLMVGAALEVPDQ
jgi:hypothetical protein